MIKSFRHKGLKRLYEPGDRSKLPFALVERIEEVLGLLDVASICRISGCTRFQEIERELGRSR